MTVDVLLDGVAGAAITAAVAFGTAIYVLRRTLEQDRVAASHQQDASRALFEEQVRANAAQAQLLVDADERLARQRASLDTATRLSYSLNDLAASLSEYRIRLAGEGRVGLMGRLAPLVHSLDTYVRTARAETPLLLPANLRSQLLGSINVCHLFAARFRYEATDYLLQPEWPDSKEAASLTKAGRAWQRCSILVAQMTDYTYSLATDVGNYQQSGSDADSVPVPPMTADDHPAYSGAASRGVPELLEWLDYLSSLPQEPE